MANPVWERILDEGSGIDFEKTDGRPRMSARNPDPVKLHGAVKARKEQGTGLASVLGAEADPEETAKEAYRAVARGEIEDTLLSPGAAKAVIAGMGAVKGLEVAGGATGIGSVRRPVVYKMKNGRVSAPIGDRDALDSAFEKVTEINRAKRRARQGAKNERLARIDGRPSPVIDRSYKNVRLIDRVDPATEPAFKRVDDEYGKGIVVYDVEDSPNGQMAVRRAVEGQEGRKANPWCLIETDSKGKLTPAAKKIWKEYNSVPKQIAYDQDGKIIAFRASPPRQRGGMFMSRRDNYGTWWTLDSNSAFEPPAEYHVQGDGIPFKKKDDKDPTRTMILLVGSKNNPLTYYRGPLDDRQSIPYDKGIIVGYERGQKRGHSPYEFWDRKGNLRYRRVIDGDIARSEVIDTDGAKASFDLRRITPEERDELVRFYKENAKEIEKDPGGFSWGYRLPVRNDVVDKVDRDVFMKYGAGGDDYVNTGTMKTFNGEGRPKEVYEFDGKGFPKSYVEYMDDGVTVMHESNYVDETGSTSYMSRKGMPYKWVNRYPGHPAREGTWSNDMYQEDTRYLPTHQAAKGGESSTSKRESTAPTQEQIQEALEFLRMFRERETPSNEWEASAIDRLEKLVVAAVKAEPRGETPEAPVDDGTVQGAVGAGDAGSPYERYLDSARVDFEPSDERPRMSAVSDAAARERAELKAAKARIRQNLVDSGQMFSREEIAKAAARSGNAFDKAMALADMTVKNVEELAPVAVGAAKAVPAAARTIKSGITGSLSKSMDLGGYKWSNVGNGYPLGGKEVPLLDKEWRTDPERVGILADLAAKREAIAKRIESGRKTETGQKIVYEPVAKGHVLDKPLAIGRTGNVEELRDMLDKNESGWRSYFVGTADFPSELVDNGRVRTVAGVPIGGYIGRKHEPGTKDVSYIMSASRGTLTPDDGPGLLGVGDTFTPTFHGVETSDGRREKLADFVKGDGKVFFSPDGTTLASTRYGLVSPGRGEISNEFADAAYHGGYMELLPGSDIKPFGKEGNVHRVLIDKSATDEMQKGGGGRNYVASVVKDLRKKGVGVRMARVPTDPNNDMEDLQILASPTAHLNYPEFYDTLLRRADYEGPGFFEKLGIHVDKDGLRRNGGLGVSAWDDSERYSLKQAIALRDSIPGIGKKHDVYNLERDKLWREKEFSNDMLAVRDGILRSLGVDPKEFAERMGALTPEAVKSITEKRKFEKVKNWLTEGAEFNQDAKGGKTKRAMPRRKGR